MAAFELKIVEAIADDLQREGMSCRVDCLVDLNPRLRHLLGDRKFLSFLREYPLIFNIDCSTDDHKVVVKLTADWSSQISLFANPVQPPCVQKVPPFSKKSEIICSVCRLGFPSRNKLFTHLSSGSCGNPTSGLETTAGSKKTIPIKKHVKDIVNEVVSYIRKKGTVHMYELEGCRYVPIHWLTSFSKIKRLLRVCLRDVSLVDVPACQRHTYDSPQWWEKISEKLLDILLLHPAIFRIEAPFEQAEAGVSVADPSSAAGSDVALRGVEEVECSSDALPYNPNSIRNVRVILINTEMPTELTVVKKSNKYSDIPASVDVISSVSAHENAVLRPFTAEDIVTECASGLVVYKPCGVRMEDLVEQVRVYLGQDNSVLSNTALGSTEEIIMSSSTVTSTSTQESSKSYLVESVSRLDQQTSGLVVLPTTLESEHYLTDQFRDHKVLKFYVCAVLGAVGSVEEVGKEYVVSAKLLHVEGTTRKTFVHPRGKPSSTRYWVVGRGMIPAARGLGRGGEDGEHVQYSIVLCQPLTGRTHQIRAHMNHLGHPLLGDYKYSRTLQKDRNKATGYDNCGGEGEVRMARYIHIGRMMLHSLEMSFMDISGCATYVASSMPSSFVDLIDILDSPTNRTSTSCEPSSTSSDGLCGGSTCTSGDKKSDAVRAMIRQCIDSVR